MSVYFSYPQNINLRIKELKERNPNFWLKKGKKQLDKLIKFVIETTPAYRKFLKDSGVDYKQIAGFKDFERLPLMNKDNYLRSYPYQELFSNKNLNLKTISATSGSTGEPFYFIRGENLQFLFNKNE